jgi:hypothetical protein
MTDRQQEILTKMDAMKEPQIRRVGLGVYLLMDGVEPLERVSTRTVNSMVKHDLLQDVDNGEFVRPGDTWWR